MLNSGGIAVSKVSTPDGQVSYEGGARIDGVPGTAAPVMIDFADVAGSNCGALLPTGKAVDRIDGISVTCVDNGMPVVVMRASDFGRTGYESPVELERDGALKSRLESIRIQAGPMMNLGDVAKKTVPKMSLIASPQHGGVVATRTFIPYRVHQSIGVLGAASVAAACCISGSVAEGVTEISEGGEMDIEHPTGRFTVDIAIAEEDGPSCRKPLCPAPHGAQTDGRDRLCAAGSRGMLIIDCHGHYTTAPKPHQDYRKAQLDRLADPSLPPPEPANISDDEIRESIEQNQLKLLRERGADLTIFSPRASAMAHHLGDTATSMEWARANNDLIRRVIDLYPQYFAGAAQLPQVANESLAGPVEELDRAVNELGFVGCNLSLDPSGGHWTSPPLTDR